MVGRRTLFLLCLAAAAPLARGFSPAAQCGNDHPSLAAEMAAPPLVRPQAYHAADARALQQQPGTQAYGGRPYPNSTQCGSQSYDTTWVPLTPASARPIRITVVWDLIANGDTGVCDDGTPGPCTYQCTSAGQAGVKVKSADGVTYTSAGFTCSGSDAVGALKPDNPSNYYSPAMNVNAKIMYDRTMAAVNFWGATLQVVPVLDSIVIPTSGLSNSALGVTRHVCPAGAPASCALTYANTDLVVVMTARPSPNSPIAGYALCLQSDQWGRCTVGHFNWVPGGLDAAGYALGSEASKEAELHTALHELVHVFGGMGPGSYQPSSNFIDNASGCRQPTASVMLVRPDDPAFPAGASKPVTYIVSPRVANLTRLYYNCPTAVGFPLEDVPLGKGAHWEARVAGSELMSYGANSGQVYISDLTLAYLEDTGHFYANYSNAGFILVSSYNSAALDAATQSFLGPSGQPYVPPPPLPPGAPRWGYRQGCDWLGQPTALPGKALNQAIAAPYTCAAANAQTCTADNRMSAVCIVQSTYTAVSDTPSYGQYNQVQAGATGSPAYGPQGLPTPGALTGYRNTLPLWAQWFSDAGAQAATANAPGATGANTGGYNDAMDYMPVPVGYWSCAFQIPGSNSTPAVGDQPNFLSAFSSSLGAYSDMQKFGGQLRCPTCRCMQSSLMEMRSGNLQTSFPSYGLCYRTNCAMTSYLQVAIKGQFDQATYWYQCPEKGGKLYIPGFFGALTCPPALTFCALEPISGLRYPEQDVYWEWIFWLALCSGMVLVFLTCALPCIRERCITFWKICCGARVFDPPGGHEEGAPTMPFHPVAARSLMVISFLTFISGAAIAGTMAWVIKSTLVFTGTVDVLSIGIMLLMLSLLGCCASYKRAEFGPSCWAISYFFLVLMVILLSIFVVIYQFQFSTWTETVTKYYQPMVSAGFYKPQNISLSDNIGAAAAKVSSNIQSLMALAIVVILFLFAGVVASGQLIQARVLASIVLCFVNNLLCGFGMLMVAVSIYIFVKNGAVLAGAYDLMGYMLGMALLFIVVAIAGHCAVRNKSFPLLMVYIFFSLALLGACMGGVWLAFNNSAAVVTWVSNADDNMISSVANSLYLSSNKAGIITGIKGNMQKIGLAFGVLLILQALSLVCAAVFGWAANNWRIEYGLKSAPAVLSKNMQPASILSAQPRTRDDYYDEEVAPNPAYRQQQQQSLGRQQQQQQQSLGRQQQQQSLGYSGRV